MKRAGSSRNGKGPDGKLKPSKRRPGKKRALATVGERFDFLIGKAAGLPADFSRNLDHYLYGAPKRS